MSTQSTPVVRFGVLIGLVCVFAGWYVRENWEVIGGYLSTYGKIVLLFIGLVVGIRFIFRARKEEGAEKNSKE